MNTITQLIRTVIADTGLSDPRAIAERVASETDDATMRKFFAQTLVAEVRAVLSVERNEAMTGVFNPKPRSAKVTGIRDWWSALMASSVHVGKSQWKPFGECTSADLEFLSQERRWDAARELIRASQFDRLRELLEKHEVTTIAELPSNAVKDFTL